MSSKILEPGEIESAAMTPPFVQLPPTDMFAKRAERFASLAADHPMSAYLNLLANICRAQQSVLDAPPTLPELDRAIIDAALKHDMPPLAVDTLLHDSGWQTQLDAWLTTFTEQNPDLPEAVNTALQRLRDADSAQRSAWATALCGGRFSEVPEALVPFLGAALQLAWRDWLNPIDIEAIR